VVESNSERETNKGDTERKEDRREGGKQRERRTEKRTRREDLQRNLTSPFLPFSEQLHFVGYMSSNGRSNPTVISLLEEPDTANFPDPVYIGLLRTRTVREERAKTEEKRREEKRGRKMRGRDRKRNRRKEQEGRVKE
jgi:hypothetical protein